ncbi:type II toxin-antitoxin system prevent-host-death family antitoxin [Azospirillum sp. sgz301742]
MPVVGASEFVRGFGRFQDEAYREVVKVTSHGRVIGGYLSAPDLAHYERLKRRERELLVVGDLPDEVVADIEAAEYGADPT